jgi:hypothetical protein
MPVLKTLKKNDLQEGKLLRADVDASTQMRLAKIHFVG